MSESEIDEALEAVVAAARNHRAILSSQTASPEEIWAAYTALNNASVHYDDLISRAYDEVTPWDCEYIDENELENAAIAEPPATKNSPPSSVHISVRHRRDYLITDPAAVLSAANIARATMAGGPQHEVTHVGQAIYALIDAGDGTIAALDDIEELEPGNGVLLINELDSAAEPTSRADAESLFVLPRPSRLLYRLDEVMVGDE